MNGCIVKIGQYHYLMREVGYWFDNPIICFNLLYWVEEVPV